MDLTTLSDAELDALESQFSSSAPVQAVAIAPSLPDLSQLSNEQLDALEQTLGSSRTQDWNIGQSLKNFGSGAVEGVVGLAGLAADLNPFNIGPRVQGNKIEFGVGPDFNFTQSKQAQQTLDPLLAEKDRQYRYARTLGNFIGQGALTAGTGAITNGIRSAIGPLAKSAITDTAAGTAAQSAEDITGDTKIAPLIAAVLGGVGTSAGMNILSNLKRSLIGASEAEIKGTAAKAFKDTTGLSAVDIPVSSANPLEQLQTTAERTGNAGAAQLEKTLAATAPRAEQYNALTQQRDALREKMIGAMTPVRGINPEGLGSELIDKASAVRGSMESVAQDLWSQVPRHELINIVPEQKNLVQILKQRQAGLEPGSKVSTLIQQFTDPERHGILSSGALQDIRSDALTLLRDANLMPEEQRILASIQDGIDKAMVRGLEDYDSSVWKAARGATAETKKTFQRGTAGGSLTDPMARPSNVLANAFKGDAQSVKQLKAAIANDPTLIEKVQRGILDRIPRDSKEQLTPNNMKKFLAANDSGLREILGESHLNELKTILSDLQSQAKVSDLAFAASKGNSVTAQRQTVAGAIHDTILSEFAPPGPLGRIWDVIRKGAGIKDTEKVNDLLFKAAIDPSVARELAGAPTAKRIKSIGDFFVTMLQDMGKTGAGSAAKELSRTQTNITPAGSLEAAAAIVQEQKDSNLLNLLKNAIGASGAARSPTSQQKSQGQGSALSKPTPESQLSGQVAQKEGTPLAQLLGSLQRAPKATAKEDPTFNNTASSSPATQALINRTLSTSRNDIGSLVKTVLGGSMTANVKDVEAEIDSDPYMSALYEAESGRNPNAKNPESSAKGGFQFLNATAKSMGLDDPMDLEKSLNAARALTESHKEMFGTDDPSLLYSAHYLGATVLRKFLSGKPLTSKEQAQVDYLNEKALPRFERIYEKVMKKRSGVVEA